MHYMQITLKQRKFNYPILKKSAEFPTYPGLKIGGGGNSARQEKERQNPSMTRSARLFIIPSVDMCSNSHCNSVPASAGKHFYQLLSYRLDQGTELLDC